MSLSRGWNFSEYNCSLKSADFVTIRGCMYRIVQSNIQHVSLASPDPYRGSVLIRRL